MIPKPLLRPITVLQAIADQYGITVAEIQGVHRDKKTAKVRAIAAICLRDLCELPSTRTGELLGGKDHSTILYAWKKANLLILDVEHMKAILTFNHQEINPS